MLVQEKIKYVLTRVGSRCSTEFIYGLDAVINYLEVGRWMKSRGFTNAPRLSNRYDIFELVGRSVKDKEVLYLEFGVSKGKSMERWSQILRNPKAVLHGFDSFDGLPEDWNWPGQGKELSRPDIAFSDR